MSINWTARDERQLREMYDAGTPASVIGKLLGRSTRAIYKRVSVLGLSSPERTQERGRERSNADAYHRGREARANRRAKVTPHGLGRVEQAFWLAGWHDRDIELGFSVIKEKTYD